MTSAFARAFRLVIPTFCLLLQIGCASRGFNRGELKALLGGSSPVFDDKAIKDAFDKKPNLPKPFKLGVYFATPKKAAGADRPWRWTEADKAVLEDLGQELRSAGLVSDMFPILDSVIEGADLGSLRLAAAKHHADALLIVRGAGQLDRFINKWGWSYILLLPTLFAPGSQADTLFVTEAALWDVRNEYLYLTAESEATTQNTYVAAFSPSDADLLNSAKSQALSRLKQELRKMIQGARL